LPAEVYKAFLVLSEKQEQHLDAEQLLYTYDCLASKPTHEEASQ
jgi:hypothetical protein